MANTTATTTATAARAAPAAIPVTLGSESGDWSWRSATNRWCWTQWPYNDNNNNHRFFSIMQYPSNTGFYKYDSAHWPGVEYNFTSAFIMFCFSVCKHTCERHHSWSWSRKRVRDTKLICERPKSLICCKSPLNVSRHVCFHSLFHIIIFVQNNVTYTPLTLSNCSALCILLQEILCYTNNLICLIII